MSTIQVRNINFEPTGNNRITYESSNGYFAIVLGGNRVLDFASGNLNLIVSGFSTNVVSTNTFATNVITSNTVTSNNITVSNSISSNTLSISYTFSANGSVGTINQVLSSQGPGQPAIWKDVSGTPDYIIMAQGVI